MLTLLEILSFVFIATCAFLFSKNNKGSLSFWAFDLFPCEASVAEEGVHSHLSIRFRRERGCNLAPGAAKQRLTASRQLYSHIFRRHGSILSKTP